MIGGKVMQHIRYSLHERRGRGRYLLAFALLLSGGGSFAAGAKEILIPGDRVFPESITGTSDGTLFIGSITEGAVYRVPPGADRAEPFLASGKTGLHSVIGVLADEASGTLFVCSSNFSFAGIVIPTGKGLTSLWSFNLKSGEAKASVPLPGEKAFCNDLAIGKDGAVYVADSFNPHILRLKPGASSFEVWASDPRFAGEGFNLDGIAFGSDGNLYVNTYNSHRLFKIAVEQNGAAGAVTELQSTQALDHPDGLRALGTGEFLMIEGAGRLDKIIVSGENAKVEVLKDGYKVPVSVWRTGSEAWVLEGQLNLLFDPALKGTKPDPFKAYAVPLK
jgi:sugar lactone lactonase YvrE